MAPIGATTSPGDDAPQASPIPWQPYWMPAEAFRLTDAPLLDLSVDPSHEGTLRRSRWHAAVKIALPNWLREGDAIGFANFVDAHLRGRSPVTASRPGLGLVTFAVTGPSEANRLLVERFAQSFCDPEVFGRFAEVETDIFHVDLSDIESSLPEEMQSIS